MPIQTAPTSTPDPLLATEVFWARYKTPILVALLVIALGIAAVGAYRFYSARQDAAAAQLLSGAKGEADYEKVIAQYPSSGAAASAHLLLAGQQRGQQQFAEANGSLQKFVSKFPKHQLITAAKMAMAGNLESLGKPDEALESYRRVAADHPKSFNAPLALLAQVPVLRAKGQIEEARRVCETVLTQYRDSYASTEASRQLRLLKPPASAMTAPPVAGNPPPAVAPTP